MKSHSFTLLAALSAGFFTLQPLASRAADHGDAPALSQDLGADIADVFAFQDPSDLTNSTTIIIGTVHGFLVPGEVANFAVFDDTIRYRFEIYNDHVNDNSSPYLTGGTAAQKAAYLARVKPARTIDVTFSKRGVGTAVQTGSGGAPIPQNLLRPVQQEATLTFTGFPGLRNKGIFTQDNAATPTVPSPLKVSPFSVTAATAPGFVTHSIDVLSSTSGTNPSVKFFAGEVDDPFFFDIPAFNAFIDSVRIGSPNVNVFSRARDTFAGYNVLSIVLSIPTNLLINTTGPHAGPIIGVDFMTQRHVTKLITNNGFSGVGAFKTVDRMGNPTVNVALIPFDLKNTYNSGTVKDDVQLRFAGAITETLDELGVGTASQSILQNLAIARGDLIQLNTSITNTGSNANAGFPNGRRLQDDTIQTVLTTINNGTLLDDGVTASDPAPTNTFPFVAPPNQPLFNVSATADDKTRN